MRIKYVRWSTIQQSGARQLLDSSNYDLVMQEQISGSIPFNKRPKGAALIQMIFDGKVTDLYVEEFSRLGRNALDTLSVLKICDEKHVNVHIQNMSISSISNGKPNSLFKLCSHIISVIGEQEREAILERTQMGKIAARQRGVIFGRRPGTNERKSDFLNKTKNKKILKYLGAGEYSIREIAILANASTATVLKVKRTGEETKCLAIRSNK